MGSFTGRTFAGENNFWSLYKGYMSPVEAFAWFATGMKSESSNQWSFKSGSRVQDELQATKINNQVEVSQIEELGVATLLTFEFP